ncbi:uncharacterized protein EAE98_011128 [Botrytis deweyae]|uniref:Uncharacterized protein n=1 Tax=Botrytis deweyae TaxID=2478750 RepID=A0ABQ7I6W6_9HELO|nr:uncharacterized protein EAE98_011128 [Botrytis deweyae]KAF7915525.1 hypothetical protein EAE98_011128 [Botrytis deweyae]
MQESEGSEWQREPLPDFLRSPGLQNFIKEVYKGKKAKPYPQDFGQHNFEFDLGDAAYDYAVSDGPVKQTWGDLSQWFNAERGYDGTSPKVAPPKESDELDIQPKYNDLFWRNHSIDSIAKQIASHARDENSDPPIDYYHKPKPFLRGLIDFQNIFGHKATEAPLSGYSTPLSGYSKQNLREDLIAASLFHHIAITILKNPFFFLDDVKNLNGSVDGPHNPVDKLYHDLLQHESPQKQHVAKSFRAHTLRLLRPQEEYSYSKSIAAITNGKIRRVAQARARQWLRSEAQDLWLPTIDKIDEHEVEILYERAAELAVEVASMTWTDIQIETLKDYTPLPHPTIPCLPLSFWKHYKADPALHHISDMSRYIFGDIPVPPQDLKVLNELEKQVKLVRCRLVIYVHVEHPSNTEAKHPLAKHPYIEVEGYPFPDPVRVKDCPEQIYLELPELEKQEPDPRKLERVYSDEDLAKLPPRLRGMFGDKLTWRKVWKFYKWLFDSALYNIPFYAVALGVPFILAWGFYKLLSLGADEEVDWWFLPNIRNLFYSWRDALSSYFFGILGWLGILKLYGLAMTILHNIFSPWLGTLAHGRELALHSVTAWREHMSGLYDATAEYVVSTRIWNLLPDEWGFLIGFLCLFIPSAILYHLAGRGFAGAPGPAPLYIRPLIIVILICQSLWLDSVRGALIDFTGYVSDVPKIVMDMFEGLLNLPETFNWMLEWISGIGGDTSVTIIPELDPSQPGVSIKPEPEPGTHDDVPQPFQLSPKMEEELSRTTLGGVLTGSKLGKAIQISNLSKEQELSSIAEMLEQSQLSETIEDFGFGQSLVGREPIGQSLKGSLLGYILTGSDTEKRLVTAQLGATLAKSDFAEQFVGSEMAKTLTQSELAERITEALNTDLGLGILDSDLKGHAKEMTSVSMLAKVISGLNLAETLEGSLLGKILTGSTSGPILPVEALTAWEGLSPPEPYIPGTLVIGVEPASTVVTKITTIVMKPITMLLTPFQLIGTKIVSVLMKAPMIESLLPTLTTVANTALKPLAPVIGFLSGLSSTTEQSSDQKPGFTPETEAPISGSVLPIIAKAFTIILKPIAALVAKFSGSSFTDLSDSYLKISFDPAKVSSVISSLIIPVLVVGFYIVVRRYIAAWAQGNREEPVPPQRNRLRGLFTYVFHKLRSAYRLFRRFLGVLAHLAKYVFRPFRFLLWPFILLCRLIVYVLRPLRPLGYPFVYVYGQITRFGGYIWRSIVDRIPPGRFLLVQFLTLILFTLGLIMPILLYAYWLFEQYQDYRHPRPQLRQLPFVNRIIGFFMRVYEIVLQLFADTRQKLADLYNFLHLNAFAPLRGIIDATTFLFRQIVRTRNIFYRTLKLVFYSTAFLIYVLFGWETEAFFDPGQNPEILLALRAIRSYLWKTPFARVIVPRRGDDLADHRFPGFAQRRHRSLPHPQWFPYFHLLIGASIGIFAYLTAGDHPSGRDFLHRTSELNSTLEESLKN